jgi:hypothetical protein
MLMMNRRFSITALSGLFSVAIGCGGGGASTQPTYRIPQAEPSSSETAFTVHEVTTGRSHSCALTLSGDVACWGSSKCKRVPRQHPGSDQVPQAGAPSGGRRGHLPNIAPRPGNRGRRRAAPQRLAVTRRVNRAAPWVTRPLRAPRLPNTRLALPRAERRCAARRHPRRERNEPRLPTPAGLDAPESRRPAHRSCSGPNMRRPH